MFETLTNDDVGAALESLLPILGVKSEPSRATLVSLLRRRKVQECVVAIASHMGLPIAINLTYVHAGYTPGDSDRFKSTQLTKTDWRGQGVGGIVAQVRLPNNLPIYASSNLVGYPVHVRVSEDCHDTPDTFIGIMAHELSHVLLRTLRHPRDTDELYTEIVPLLMGFSSIVLRGREVIRSSSDGFTTTSRTMKYGYPTDSQFQFARKRVRDILKQVRADAGQEGN